MLDIDGTSNQQFHSHKEYMDQEGLVQTFPKWRQTRRAPSGDAIPSNEELPPDARIINSMS